MAPLHERLDITKRFITDDDVTTVEALRHLYWWSRFEITMIRRNHHRKMVNKLNLRGEKITARLNDGLEIINFRKHLKDL